MLFKCNHTIFVLLTRKFFTEPNVLEIHQVVACVTDLLLFVAGQCSLVWMGRLLHHSPLKDISVVCHLGLLEIKSLTDSYEDICLHLPGYTSLGQLLRVCQAAFLSGCAFHFLISNKREVQFLYILQHLVLSVFSPFFY